MEDRSNVVVVDTSVVSIIFNNDERSGYYEAQLEGKRLFISFQTLEELRFGAFKNGWTARRTNELERHLESYEIVWVDRELVETCARLRSDREKAGRKLNTADAWIAATALRLKCPLAADDGDFADIPDLQLIRLPQTP